MRPGWFLSPLPITAYSVCNALGLHAAEIAAALEASRSGLSAPPMDLPFATVCGAVRGDLTPPPQEFAVYDTRQARIALHLASAMKDAIAKAVRRWGPDRVAIVMGTSTGGIAATEQAFTHHVATGRLPSGYDYARQHAFDAFANLLARVHRISGPVFVISTACSSSGKAIASAGRLIQTGVVDAVLTGGVDTLAHTTLRGFRSLEVLSDVACRPFSRDRSGINIGEGGAMLLIERATEGQEPRTHLLGVGESSDAYHMSSPHPEGLGAKKAMRAALDEGAVRPAEVDYVCAHGTGTKYNDATEAAAISEVLGDSVPVVSTKGYTGHMLGAAAATGAVFSILALEKGWIPASLGAGPVDPELRIFVNLERRAHACRVVMSNSFGFGGSNVAVLLGSP